MTVLVSRILLAALLGVPAAAPETLKTPIWIESGEPAGKGESFQVTLDGEPVTVQSVQAGKSDLILMVVMDVTNRPDRVDAARAALLEQLENLDRRAYTAVMTAQDGLSVLQDPTRNRARIREKLEAIDARGFPGLLDSVEQASEIADRTLAAADVRVAVLFVTDGGIEDYRNDYTSPVVNPSDRRDLSRRFRGQLVLERVRSITDVLESAQAPLFFLHLQRKKDELNEIYQNGITQFAAVTGGEALFAQSLQELPIFVERLVKRIASHTVLTLDVQDDQIHKVEILREGAQVTHRDHVRLRRAETSPGT